MTLTPPWNAHSRLTTTKSHGCIRRSLALLALAVATMFAEGEFAEGAVQTAPPLELVVLGSGGPGALGRAASCHLLLVDGQPRILVDAGPGCFVRLGEAGLPLENLDIQLFTHLHADHAGDFPGFVKARAVSVRRPLHYDVFGPEGHKKDSQGAYFPSTSHFVDLLFGPEGAFAYLSGFVAPIDFVVTDLPPTRPGLRVPPVIYDHDGLKISYLAGHHRDAPSIMYRIEHGGKSIAFSGDVDADGLENLIILSRSVSLLVVNAVVLDPPKSPPILYTLHSPPGAFGKVAGAAKVGRLVLAHLSPATDGHSGEVAASIGEGYAGPVIFAEDKLRITP